MKRTTLKRKTPLRRGKALRPKSKLRRRKDNSGSTYWRNKANKKWGEYVHLPECCAMCGTRSRKLDAHHIITKTYPSTRCKVMNGILLCICCHKTSNYLSAHGHAVAFSQWLEANRPEQFKWISEHKHTPGSCDYKADYERLCKLLETVK